MKKWWIGAALAAICFGQSARAQYPPGGLLPEPAPVAPAGGHGPGGQQYMPGPLTGASAPPGPDESLSLPCDIHTAWGKGPIPESGLYVHLGGQSLKRQQPGHSVIAVNQAGEILVDTHQIDPDSNTGPVLTVGYLFDNAAIELTGFYLFDQRTTAGAVAPGQLTVPFFNPPAEFTGLNGNGIWSQANVVSEQLQYSLGNAELNYRWWSRTMTGVEGIVGLRYVNLQERATIFTDDIGGAPRRPDGGPNLALASTYMTRINQNMFLAQTGFEWDLPVRSWFVLGVMAKTGIGADDIELTTRLTNAADFVGAQGRSNKWTYTSLNEVSMFIDLAPLERMHIRLGYTAMWLLHVSEGLSQIDFNLAANPPPIHEGGSIFYHGPMVQVQFLF